MQTIYLTFQCCIFDKGDVLQHNAKPFKGKCNIFGAFLKTKYRHRENDCKRSLSAKKFDQK